MLYLKTSFQEEQEAARRRQQRENKSNTTTPTKVQENKVDILHFRRGECGFSLAVHEFITGVRKNLILGDMCYLNG